MDSLKKYHITHALNGTEDENVWNTRDINSELKLI